MDHDQYYKIHKPTHVICVIFVQLIITIMLGIYFTVTTRFNRQVIVEPSHSIMFLLQLTCSFDMDWIFGGEDGW